MAAKQSAKLRLALFERMLLIRRFEEPLRAAGLVGHRQLGDKAA